MGENGELRIENEDKSITSFSCHPERNRRVSLQEGKEMSLRPHALHFVQNDIWFILDFLQVIAVPGGRAGRIYHTPREIPA